MEFLECITSVVGNGFQMWIRLASRHGVVRIDRVEFLLVTTVVGGFSAGAVIAIDMTGQVYEGVVHLVSLHGCLINFHTNTRFSDTR